jgi:hypothetical protein
MSSLRPYGRDDAIRSPFSVLRLRQRPPPGLCLSGPMPNNRIHERKMVMSKAQYALLLAIGIVPFRTTIAIANCDNALVRATYNLGNKIGIDWRLADLVDNSSYDEIKHSAGGNAVIYGVPVGVNYDDYKNRIDNLKHSHNEQLSYSQQLNVAWSGLDPNAVNAYHDCLKTEIINTSGLHAVVTGATDSDISILIRWNVPGQLSTPVTWQGAAQITTLFPPALGQGDITLIVPRPSLQMSIAGNGGGYTTQSIVLEPLPPPAPDITPQWVSFTSPNFVTKDGGGSGVGNISGINFQLLVNPASGPAPTPYKFTYDYYNGSGTWRGAQAIYVKLLDSNNSAVDVLKFGVDRGRCIYGHTEPRPQPAGMTPNIDATKVRAISVETDAVSGRQTPC